MDRDIIVEIIFHSLLSVMHKILHESSETQMFGSDK